MIDLFSVLCPVPYIVMGSCKDRGNQYMQLVKVHTVNC